MNLAERLAAHPEIAVGGCITWIFVVVWVMAILHWTIQGDIDMAFGVLGIVIGIGLGIVAISPPVGKEFITALVMFAVVGTVAMFIPLRNVINRHELVAIDIEAIKRAYDQLEERPNNVGARFKIAKLAYRRGLTSQAIRLADEALKGMPQDFFTEEHKLVDMWKRQGLATSQKPIPCVECGTGNVPGELYCKKCHAKLMLDQAQGKWIGRALTRKLFAGWVALLGVFVGIPVTASTLPPGAALVAILGLSTLVLTTLYAAFMGAKPGRT